MRRILNIPVQEVLPSVSAILEVQGIPRWVKPDERTEQLARDALSMYEELSDPVGLVMEIPNDSFKNVLEGEGLNEEDSPVYQISRSSDQLALFAVTLGGTVCREISRHFKENDYAVGLMLDSAASEGAELTSQIVENIYRKHLKTTGRFNRGQGMLRFSPGYCGWHISAQKKLFRALRPDEIGITLNESFLMQPIKSISGVIIAGKKDIFDFEDVFMFCRECATHTCRDRIKALSDQ